MGENSLSLENAVADLAGKFLLGGVIKLADAHTVHVAVLVSARQILYSYAPIPEFQRRFAIENPRAIHYEDESVESDAEDYGGSLNLEEGENESGRGQKRPRASANASKKPKSRNRTGIRGGRVPKGQDWWSQVEDFFVEKRRQWGDNLEASADWKR